MPDVWLRPLYTGEAADKGNGCARLFVMSTAHPEEEVAKAMFEIMSEWPSETEEEYNRLDNIYRSALVEGLKTRGIVSTPVGFPILSEVDLVVGLRKIFRQGYHASGVYKNRYELKTSLEVYF